MNIKTKENLFTASFVVGVFAILVSIDYWAALASGYLAAGISFWNDPWMHSQWWVAFGIAAGLGIPLVLFYFFGLCYLISRYYPAYFKNEDSTLTTELETKE